jgi:hypothetical protein
LGPDGAARPLGAAAGPIEAVIEREPEIRLHGWTPWSVAVRAGRRLNRILVEAGLGDVAMRFAGHDGTRFDASTIDKEPVDELPLRAQAEPPVQGSADNRYRLLLTGSRHMIDGAKVLAMMSDGPTSSATPILRHSPRR